jgi:uncharacterized protein involved in exopolysaccharide biosynthesis
MSPDTTPFAQAENDISLKEVLQTLWRYRIRFLLCIVVVLAAATVTMFLVTKKYEAEVILAPSEDNSKNASGAIGSLSNNLAALAGVPVTSDPKKAEAIAVLQSETLTERYIRENNLLPILYASKWDAVNGRWKTTDPDRIPTLWKANQYFKQNVRTVKTDTKTGLVTLGISWKDPKLAAKWANDLVKMTNDYERDVALAESDRNIRYLTEQAALTDQVGIKQTIYSLLESEFSKAMLAKGNEEYSFKVIDPATVPEKPTFPNRTVWLLTALFGSISISIFAAFCIVAWRKG